MEGSFCSFFDFYVIFQDYERVSLEYRVVRYSHVEKRKCDYRVPHAMFLDLQDDYKALKASELTGGENHPISIATRIREARLQMNISHNDILNTRRPDLVDMCHQINSRICDFSELTGKAIHFLTLNFDI